MPGHLGAMVQGKSITAKLGAGIYFRAAARTQSIADTVFFHTRLATVEQDQLLCWAHHHVRFGSFASILACPQHVRLRRKLGNTGCPILPKASVWMFVKLASFRICLRAIVPRPLYKRRCTRVAIQSRQPRPQPAWRVSQFPTLWPS